MSTIFTDTLSNGLGDETGQSFRIIVVPTAGSLGQIRVTFPSSNLGLNCAHCSAGKAATAPNTAVTPVELTFSGGHGFSLGANSQIVSDWATLAFTGTDQLVVVMDITGGAPKFSNTINTYYK